MSAVLVVFASALLVGTLALLGVPPESSWVRHTNVLVARLGVCVLAIVLAVLAVWAVVRALRED
jgi:hypothetical protein